VVSKKVGQPELFSELQIIKLHITSCVIITHSPSTRVDYGDAWPAFRRLAMVAPAIMNASYVKTHPRNEIQR
jgi:hypothetical protein